MKLLVVVEKTDTWYREKGLFPIESEEEKQKILRSIEQTYKGKIERQIKKQGDTYDFISATIALNIAQKLGYNCFWESYKINNSVFIYIFDKVTLVRS